MTPLFWLKVVLGKVLKIAASAELTPSPRTPPSMRPWYASPSIGSPETEEVAVRSPIVSIAVIR